MQIRPPSISPDWQALLPHERKKKKKNTLKLDIWDYINLNYNNVTVGFAGISNLYLMRESLDWVFGFFPPLILNVSTFYIKVITNAAFYILHHFPNPLWFFVGVSIHSSIINYSHLWNLAEYRVKLMYCRMKYIQILKAQVSIINNINGLGDFSWTLKV